MTKENYYCRMVDCTSPTANDLMVAITCDAGVRPRLSHIVKHVASMVTYSDVETGFQSYERMITQGSGNCLSISCLLCALIRTAGARTDEVLVIVGGNPDHFREAAHAWLVVNHSGERITIDPAHLSDGESCDLEKLRVYLAFNDKTFLTGNVAWKEHLSWGCNSCNY